MKKTDGIYVLKWYGGTLGAIVAMFVLGLALRIPLLFFAAIVALIPAFIFVPAKLKSTMEKSALVLENDFAAKQFVYQQKFTTYNAVFYIDVGGKMGVIWKHNPKEFFLIDLAGLSDIRTHDGKQLNGTSLVSCQFKLDGERFKIYTLRVSNGQLSMKSAEVLEAISKADKLCEMLSVAKQSALAAQSVQ